MTLPASLEAACVAEPKRRRQWSDAERRRLVALSNAPGASVAKVALRHGVNANLLFNWRRRYGAIGLAGSEVDGGPGFALIDLAAPSPEPTPGGIIEIELGGGERVRVGYDVDQAALGRVFCALKAAR